MSDNNQIIEVISNSHVEVSTAIAIQNTLMPFFEQAKALEDMAKSIVVTDPTQLTEMKNARELRLKIRKIRTDADKKREELKKDSLNYAKAVQSVYNIIECLVKPLEDHLEKQEKYAETIEKQRQADLRASRTGILQPYAQFLPPLGDLGVMAEFEFQRVCDIAKTQKESFEENQRKEQEALEAKRIEEEAERNRMIEENNRLQEIARIERENREKAEREARELREKADKERKEAERKENERKEAERKEAERIEAQRIKEAQAPDIEKLMVFALSLDSITFPDVSSEKGKYIVAESKKAIANVANAVRKNAQGM